MPSRLHERPQTTAVTGKAALLHRAVPGVIGAPGLRTALAAVTARAPEPAVTPSLEFRLLGPVRVSHGGCAVPLSGSKIHTVLAALLLARGRAVSDSRLSAVLWGHTPPSTLNSQIYTYISRLRKRLGPGVDIARQGPGYVLNAPACRVDVFEFEELSGEGRRALRQGDYALAGTLLTQALDLWQGEPLENVTEHLLDSVRPQLETDRATALECRIEADLALGRHDRISAELAGLVARFPLREKLRAQLITALYRSARQAEAVRVYQEGCRELAEQLGVDPGPELRSVYQAMLRGEIPPPAAARPRATVTAAAPAPADPAPCLLPPDTLAFTGRRAELDRLRALLTPAAPGTAEQAAPQPVRVLLTGMAGVGKSALAVRAAHRAAALYPDGQLHAELCHPDGRPKSPQEVLVGLLRALDGPEPAAHPEDDLEELVRRYRSRTAHRRLLVLLDNAVGDAQLGPLLPGGPGTAVLITSRTRLAGLPEARTLPVAPLSEADALDLLGAVAGRDRVRAEPEAAVAVAWGCAGLPLALRIAGTRLASRPHWSLARFAERLADPAHRLRELRYGDLSVRESFRRSLPQVRPGTRKVLPWLSMLGEEPFSAANAADALGLSEAQAERVLEHLVDVGLVQPAPPAAARDRYRFHPLALLFTESLPHAST
ncbi:BTAD domain-containing putative transcriptional regulator [Streptomyces sp. CC224B]|uniref:AfsR/SARP family transcriptional regulator n=1 Tax=Streptomyces sp. CC224B TaxID=3044571 RepID=UPI0024A9BEDC|nr:BTAD domain-containing putative transcriptional regulator [Streptomyces sp. CC224B]